MSKSIADGEELVQFLKDTLNLECKFELVRSNEKNLGLKFSDMLISSFITNSSVGVCLSQNIQIHLTLFPLSFSLDHFLDSSAIEILYKNDMFPISLGIRWIFKSKIAHSLINAVFGAFESSVWFDQMVPNSLNIGFNTPVAFDAIFIRFESIYSYFPPKISRPEFKVKQLIFIQGSLHQDLDNNNLPDLIVVDEISSDLVNRCFKFGLPLVYINRAIFYDEFVRELHYYLSNKMKLRLIYQNSFQGKFLSN